METSPQIVFLYSAIAAAVPAFLYVAIIYWFDHYEKEPVWLLAATFFWGAVPSIFVAVVFNLVGSFPFYWLGGPTVGAALGSILVAPLVEEFVKGLAVLGIFVLMRHEIDSILDGIIYGAMVGMGFAMVENIVYFTAVYADSGFEAWRTNVFFRAVVFGLNHALFTSMTGLGFAIARFSTRRAMRWVAPIVGFSCAVLFHALHNLGATLGGIFAWLLPLVDWSGVWLVLLIIIWALLQERRWLRHYLADEVSRGTLTIEQYQVVSSNRARVRHRLQVLRREGFRGFLRAGRYYRHCSELAYKKHHATLLPDEAPGSLTEALRHKVKTLGRPV